jgi:hypothetical protein
MSLKLNDMNLQKNNGDSGRRFLYPFFICLVFFWGSFVHIDAMSIPAPPGYVVRQGIGIAKKT